MIPAPEQAVAGRSAWRVYLEPSALRMLVLGFAAGLPLLLIYGTLSFRLREAGVSRPAIGFLSWVALVYPFKWVWAPLLDRLPIPFLTRRMGRRRSWLLLSQAAVIIGLLLMARFDPQHDLSLLTACALFTAMAGATQDIALDAYRIESAALDRQAALAAAYQTGYRLGMIWAGAGALWIAARAAGEDAYRHEAWAISYTVMATSMIVGMLAVLLSPESVAKSGPPDANQPVPKASLLEPFVDFFRRYRWHAVLLLALVSSYRFANIVMGVMANPFYHDIGFTKEQVAAVSKIYGVLMALVGGFVGGAMTLRWGIARMMWAAALAASASILLYAAVAQSGPDLTLLILAVSTDNFAEGIAGTVFIAFLSGLTNRAFSATQYALLSSVTLLIPKFVAGFSGIAVDTFGYAAFFCGCAASGTIALVLLWLTQRYVPIQSLSKR
ncbi:MAG TPA: MFS transporter [Burkholderiaceae bacterium]|nr:MFS transporter [Burkholderiaceae bacterium]